MKKLLLVALSLSVLGQFDMISAMKREFNQEQEEEKSNKKIKTETTLKKLSKDEILHIFKFLNRRSADNFMQVEKRFYNIFDDVKNPEAILNFTLSDELENMNLDDKITKIIQINKKLLTALIKNIDTQEANDIFIWASGNSDIHLIRMFLKNTDFSWKIRAFLMNDSILNKIMRPIENAYILEFFLHYDRYDRRALGYLLTAEVANKILMFAVKNNLYLQNNQNSVLQKLLENKTFMDCIDAEGAQDALDEAPLYEIYELLEQNKQIRKLLKLDYSCLVQ